MFDNVSTLKLHSSAVPHSNNLEPGAVPLILYADVLAAVEQAEGLTVGVRANMKATVIKMANLISASGLQGAVIIPKLQKEFERLTPAMLNFKSDNALAAFKSNLRRALRLGGLDVMPGRHVTPFTPGWAGLMSGFGGNKLSIKLSRFAHIASTEGWEPADIGPAHLNRFHLILKMTNLGSKADKVARGTITAWAFGQKNIAGWPTGDLGSPPAQNRFYARPWSDFPAAFRQDVEAFVTRDEPGFLAGLDKIANGDEAGFLDGVNFTGRKTRVLRERTKENYRKGFLRAASILVKSGRRPESISSIADLVAFADVKKVLHFLGKRTDRQEGGYIGYLAFLLYVAARDHVLVSVKAAQQLEGLWRHVRGPYGEMSPRSHRRLQQFDEDALADRMSSLPGTLAKAARRHIVVDAVSTKLMRTALFISIGLDTGLRSGNIINLELDRHIALSVKGKRWCGSITIPGAEVKNGMDLFSTITPHTAALMRIWIDVYRPKLLDDTNAQTAYLFPNLAGGHLAGSLATQSMKDLAAHHAGIDMTPHAMRAFLGKLILDEFPDGHMMVRDLLGHRRLETTIKYYAPTNPAKAQRRWHGILRNRQEATNGRIRA